MGESERADMWWGSTSLQFSLFQEKKREEKVRELSSSPAEATIVKASGVEEVQGDYTQVLTNTSLHSGTQTDLTTLRYLQTPGYTQTTHN